MFYKEGIFWGMHLIWWIIWFGLLVWIFIGTSNLPDQEKLNENPITTLKIRFAKGEITMEEYEESNKILESEN